MDELLSDSNGEHKKIGAELAEKYLEIIGSIILILGKDGKVKLINKKGCDLLGYEKEEIIGKDWCENYLPRNEQVRVKKLIAEIFAGNIKPYQKNENPVLAKDGNIKLISWYNTVLKDEKGNIISLLCSGEDITEKREFQKRLQESEEKYRTLFNNLHEAVYLFVVKETEQSRKIGPLVEVNDAACRMLGYTRNEYKNLTIENLCPPEMLDYAFEQLDIILKEKNHTFEHVHLKKDSTRVPVEISVHATKTGNITKIISVVRDISERKKSELEKERSIKEKELLLDIIAHDLRNYLLVMNSYIELFLELVRRHSIPNIAYLHKVKGGITRATHLIENLTLILKEEIEPEKQLEPVNVKKALCKAEHILRDMFIDREITVNYQSITGNETVLADQLLELLFLNIFSNAVKYGGEKVNIAVNFKEIENNKCIISISDDSKGISPEERKKIFERFSDVAKKSGGTGLGMFIVSSLVERYDGKIEIKSRIKGDYSKGTKIAIELSMANAAQS